MTARAADVAVVGAGIVGLAIAGAYAQAGSDVVVLERHPGPGREQSTHNSGVVHSGLFARPGTLRARLNVEGSRRLYEAAPELGVQIDLCGTLVVARSPQDVDRLRGYFRWGRQNGVPDLTWLTPPQARAIEPRLGPCQAGLLAATGGRVDARGLVEALEQQLVRSGGERRYGFELATAGRSSEGWTLTSRHGEEVQATQVVNSAGIGAAQVASALGAPGRKVYPCLGEYARLVGDRRDWVRTMIYGFPPPGYPGIGVHLTRTTGGDVLVGPTATYQDSQVAPVLPRTPLSVFAGLAAAYLPGITERDLEPSAPGVRAKTVPPGSGEAFGDFEIFEQPVGSRAIHLFGIESPGLTASLAIAEYVRERWPARAT